LGESGPDGGKRFMLPIFAGWPFCARDKSEGGVLRRGQAALSALLASSRAITGIGPAGPEGHTTTLAGAIAGAAHWAALGWPLRTATAEARRRRKPLGLGSAFAVRRLYLARSFARALSMSA